MNKMSSDENYDDEFECSECDFKCTSEIDIIQHSAVHQCSNNTNDVLIISPCGKNIEDDSNENVTTVNLQAKSNSEKEVVSRNRIADTPEINDVGTYKDKIKREPSSFKVISTAELQQETEIGNTKIKIENVDIDIKQESLPIFSSHQTNKYELPIFVKCNESGDKRYSNLMPYRNRRINGRGKIYPAYNENISTGDDMLSAKTIVGGARTLSKQNEPAQNNIDLTSSSQSLTPHKIPIYVRKVSQNIIDLTNSSQSLTPYKTKRPFRVCKISRNNMDLTNPSDYVTRTPHKYSRIVCKEDDSNNLDLAHNASIEVDVDNTGFYIPPGWKRKVFMRINSLSSQREFKRPTYTCCYYTELGKRFWSKKEVYKYAEKANWLGIWSGIDCSKLNFSISQTKIMSDWENSESNVRRTIHSDNVNIFTEDFKLSSKTIVGGGGSLFKQNEPSLNNMDATNSSQDVPSHKIPRLVRKASQNNIDLINSSTTRKRRGRPRKASQISSQSLRLNMKPFSDRKTNNVEVEVDNTGFYIPPGWKRKVFMRHSRVPLDELQRPTYYCIYFTETGRKIWTKKHAYEYVEKVEIHNNAYADEALFSEIECDKLNFSVSQTLIKSDWENYMKNKIIKIEDEKEIVACNRLADIPEINDIGTYKDKIKREPSSFEVISTDEIHQETDIGNKRIKKENVDIDIKQESLPILSSNQINEYELPIFFKSKKKCKKRGPVRKASIEVEVDNTGFYIPPGWKRKVFLRTTPVSSLETHDKHRYYCCYYTEAGNCIRTKKQAYGYIERLELQNKEYANKARLSEINCEALSFSINQNVRKASIEVEVDNTGFYIPPGWKRKVFKRTNPVTSLGTHDQYRYYCCYYTGAGNCIRTKNRLMNILKG
ncbi:unnamed protein product [Meganyctiphanes norvegica]|uniref:MBD domain-containing protein n=1 Tax=Meganyctiphanes norvegica TaxID=48144 RepID=A0AAV2SLN8_MEGNR